MLTKTEFILRLKGHIARGDTERLGQTAMRKVLLEFFEKAEVTEHEDGELLKNLPKYIAAAFKNPSLTDVTKSLVQQRTDFIRKLGLLLENITGWPRCREELESYCLAQDRVIEQYFDKFLEEVYCHGLAELANINKNNMLEGGFGATMLLIRPAKDSRTIIFWRKPYYYRGEASIVVFSRGKQICQPARFVLKEVIADSFYKAIEMIEEVINRWPVNLEDQKVSFEIIKPPFH